MLAFKGSFVSQDHLGLFDTPPDRQANPVQSRHRRPAVRRLPPDIAGARHSIARNRRVHPDDRRHHVSRRADHRHPALRPGRRLSLASPDRPGHRLRLRGIASRPARAHLSRRLCPGRTARRRDQHHSVDRHLPAGGVSHRHHSLCPAQAGGFGSAAWNGTTGGEDRSWGCLQPLSWQPRSRCWRQADTTCSRRYISIVPT